MSYIVTVTHHAMYLLC